MESRVASKNGQENTSIQKVALNFNFIVAYIFLDFLPLKNERSKLIQ